MVAITDQNQASLRVERSIEIKAPIAAAFDALIEQLGPGSETPDGTPMPMTLEAWPGGRWFRDLGNGAGHLWGHVQVIKPPTLIEISGPLFMSYPALSHVQYRLVEHDDATVLQFLHQAIGHLAAEHCIGVETGWNYQLKQVKQHAEQAS